MTIEVKAAGRTDIGLVRRQNEDAFHVGEWLYVVVDGLGGHPAGDVASATAIEAIRRYDRLASPNDTQDRLAQAVWAANDAIGKRIDADPSLAGMGTTLVALLRSESTAAVANVGDSRAYLHRAGGTRQITEDHTYGHLVVDAAAVPHLPERLTRWLDGRADGRSSDLASLDLQPGDRLLLCSDGLSSYVPHALIQSVLNEAESAAVAADRLVSLAIDRGGHDNVSVIVVDVKSM